MAFARTVLTVLGTQFAAAPIALLTNIVLARMLPVADRGVYALTSEFAALAVVMMRVGWPSAVIYRVRSVRVPASLEAGATLLVLFVTSACAVAVSLALEPLLLERFFPDATREIFVIAVATIPFQLAWSFFTGMGRALDRFDLHNVQQIGVVGGLLLFVGGALLVFQPVARTAVLAFFAVHAVVGIGVTVWALAISGVRLEGAVQEVRGALAYSGRSHAQGLLLNLHQHLDVFLLAFFLDDAVQIGIYAVAVSVVNRIRLIPMSIALTMFPAVAELDSDRAAAFVARVSRHSCLWILITVVGLAVTSPVLVPLLFGDPYRASVLPLVVLLPGAGLLTVYLVLTRYFAAIDRQAMTIVTQALALTANIALNAVLIPRYGVVGAATASLVSYSLQGILLIGVFVRVSGIGWRESVVPGRAELDDYRIRGQRLLRRWRRRRA